MGREEKAVSKTGQHRGWRPGSHGPTRAHTGSHGLTRRPWKGPPWFPGALCTATSKAPVSPVRLGPVHCTAPWFGGFCDWKHFLVSCPGQLVDAPAHASGRGPTLYRVGGRSGPRQTDGPLTDSRAAVPARRPLCKWPCTASQEEAKTKEAGVSTTGSPLTMCPVSVPRGRPRRTVTGPPDLGQRSGGRESGTWLGAVGQGPGEEPGGGVALGLGRGAMASEDLVKSASCYQGNFNAAGATTHSARAPTEALLWPGPPLCV